MIEISKELLSEVLNKEITDYSVHTGFIWFKHKDFVSNINTYELAYKCKEWANKNSKYSIGSNVDNAWVWEKETDLLIEDFEAETEVEAVFKACEWIRKELDK